MPKPSERTRTKKRVSKTLPGGNRRTHYKKEITAQRLCHSCGKPLAGTSQTFSSRASRLNKSKKTVWRPYGGQICHNCLKTALKHTARET
jgi:large subunit ribosomal protein L34e